MKALRRLHNWWIHSADVGNDDFKTTAWTQWLFFHYRCLPFRPYEEGKRKRRSDDEQTLSEITAVRLHLIISKLLRLSFTSLSRKSSTGRNRGTTSDVFCSRETCVEGMSCIVCKLLQEQVQSCESRCVNTQTTLINRCQYKNCLEQVRSWFGWAADLSHAGTYSAASYWLV